MPFLFSYGTLQQEEVQQATFGRKLSGAPDELLGYVQSMVEIDNPGVVAASGKTHHPIVSFTGNETNRIPGMMFEVTEAELAQADVYEVAAYKRVAANFVSGRQAWVYIDAHSPGKKE